MTREECNIHTLQAWGMNDLMVTAAHRYCLGRRSYIVSECVDWLIKNWGLFHVETKKRIIVETQEAIEKGFAGDGCDVEQWQRLIQIERKHDA